MKSKDLSVYTVITTGNSLPCFSCVRALSYLQNSMMLTPFAPKAGPTGGEGFAAPPRTCSLIIALISFAIFCCSYLLYLTACCVRSQLEALLRNGRELTPF